MKRPAGSALAALLILLVAFALLALSALAVSVASLATAGQAAQSAQAQEAAEAAIAAVLRGWPAAAQDRPPSPAWPDAPSWITADARVARDPPEAAGAWAFGTSLADDGEGLVARHYTVTATGRARRGAAVTLEQGFSVLEPAP